ncbi:hypothetical protein HDU82_004285, partial [Entophlyctis luteolus]
MSKKIAQLTKVIYYLNTKNEDRNAEIQSLAEAYEDELNEAVKDATRQVTELRVKLEASEVKVRETEATLMLQNRKLAEGVSREENMKVQMEQIRQEADERLQSNLLAMKEMTASQQLEHQLKIDTKYKEMIELHKEEISNLKKANLSAIKQYVDDYQSAKAVLAETVSAMNKQFEEQREQFAKEKQALMLEHENKIKVMESEYEREKKELTEELTHVTKRYQEMSEVVNELQIRVKEQKVTMDEISERLIEKERAFAEAQKNQRELSAELNVVKDGLATTMESLEAAYDKISLQDQLLLDSTDKIVQGEIELKQTRERLELWQSQYNTLQANFEEAKYFSARLPTSKQHYMKQILGGLNLICKKLRQLEQTIRDMNDQADALNKKMIDALQEQDAQLRADAAQTLLQTVTDLNAQHAAELEMRRKEFESAVEQHAAEIADWRKRVQNLKDEVEEVRAFMQDQLDKMEEAKNDVKERLEATMKVLQEKSNEILQLQREVKNHLATIKTLENDKADLFQKIVKIDEQVRGEMNDRFRREKLESEQKWETFHASEMQILRDKMTQDHHLELMIAIEKTEADYKDQISRLVQEHEHRMEEWANAKAELENKCIGHEINIKMLAKGVADLKEEHSNKIANLTESHEKIMQKERKNFEYEITAKETQQKVALTIALGNQEKKHLSVLEEAESAHKKAIDELRNTNTKNALAAKKEAENKLNAEMQRLKSIHDEEMQALSDKLNQEIAETILQKNMERKAALKEQSDMHLVAIEKMNDNVHELQSEIFRRNTFEEELKHQIKNLELEIVRLNGIIDAKVAEIAKLKDKHILALDKQLENLTREHEAKVFNLNEEHIIEANKMIKEFEVAQDYLKKQIANQTKLLEEAAIKYINRESREDDVLRIAALEEDIAKRKKRAQAMMVIIHSLNFLDKIKKEELEYCKLELSNREANFNKIFNKHPLVGLMQPVTANVK